MQSIFFYDVFYFVSSLGDVEHIFLSCCAEYRISVMDNTLLKGDPYHAIKLQKIIQPLKNLKLSK